MNEDGVRVTRIDLMSAVPSLRLLEAIRLAVSLRVFVPALLLVCLLRVLPMSYGQVGETGSPNPERGLPNFSNVEFTATMIRIDDQLLAVLTGQMSKLTLHVATPALWMLMFGFCGVAAIRPVGCSFCTGTGPGVISSIGTALKCWKSILVSVLLCGILFGMSLAMFRILCWTGARTHVGITILASLIHFVISLVLATGWLLSLAGIAIDRCDGAEALSRGISYVLARWQRLFVYAAGCWLILLLSDLVIVWLLRNAHMLAAAVLENSEVGMVQEFHTAMTRFLKFFEGVFRVSILFCEIAIVYVLLRNIEDGVSTNEIDGGRVNAS